MNTDKFRAEAGPERDPLTHDIIGAAFEVHRVLGSGFLEKVYQRALQVELKLRENAPDWKNAFRFATKARE